MSEDSGAVGGAGARLRQVAALAAPTYAVALGILVTRRPLFSIVLLLPFVVIVVGLIVERFRVLWAVSFVSVSVGYAAIVWSGRAALWGLTVDPVDVLAIAGVCWAIVRLFRAGSVRIRGLVPLLLVLAVVSWPVLVGTLGGRSLEGILRDAKPVLYYGFAVVLMLVDGSLVELRTMRGLLVATTLLAALYHMISIVAGWSFESGMSGVELTTGLVSRGYGLYSAYSLYGPVGLWLMVRDATGSTRVWYQRALRVCGSVLVAVSLVTLIRSLVLGLGVALVILLIGQRRLLSARLAARLVVTALAAAIAASVIASAAGIPVSGIVERATSILRPDASSAGAAVTRQFRVDAVTTALDSAFRVPLGVGYGDIPSSSTAGVPARMVLQYSTHSSLSWLLLRTGVVGVLVWVIAAVAIGWTLLSSRVEIDDRMLILMILGSQVGESVGSNTLFGNPWSMGLVAVGLACLFQEHHRTETRCDG